MDKSLGTVCCKNCKYCRYKIINKGTVLYSCLKDNYVEPDVESLGSDKQCFSRKMFTKKK